MGENPLGKSIAIPAVYSPDILTPIRREENRQRLGIASGQLPFDGADIWNAWELSWLNGDGMPQVATARFVFPCDSENIIESKSLKLYLASFNQEKIPDQQQVTETVSRDLSRAAGTDVDVQLFGLSDLKTAFPELPAGRCLDEQTLRFDAYNVNADYLRMKSDAVITEEVLYTDLFRSNCPVTGQPDWATVTVSYRGRGLDHEGLLRYLVSYRLHNDYHENCVERIYLDIMQHCEPEELVVEANFLRRGGLDINPVRSSLTISAYEHYPRYLRQ